MIVSKNVGESMLGTQFSRIGLQGRFTHSFVQYQKDNLMLYLGRSPLIWGQSDTYSIIQSGSLATYDRFHFKVSIGNLSGEIFTGQLGSEKIDNVRITRRIGGHRLNGKFLQNKLEVQIGEQIIYTGVNRNIELFYLNPAVPYVFAAYDGDDLNTNDYNNDNGMIFVNSRFHFRNNKSLYFEFILDDFQVDNNQTQDMLGYKFGINGKTKFSTNTIDWVVEYTEIDSWTYIHHGQSTSWQNRGHPIGYPYGGDLRSFFITGNTWLKNETIQLDLEYTWLEKGYNNIQTEWENENSLEDPFPLTPKNTFHLIEASVLYKTKYVAVKTGFTNKPFPYEIANGLIDKLKGGLFLNLELTTSFDLKLEDE